MTSSTGSPAANWGLGWIVAGFGLYWVSDIVELRGDFAPVVAGGVSEERLFYHLLALGVLIAAGACFLRAGYLINRRVSAGSDAPGEETQVFAEAEEPGFDVDAAFARYIARRPDGANQGDLSEDQEPVRPAAFGRKRT